MTKIRSLVVCLAFGLVLSANAAPAAETGYVPATLKIQNSRALLDRYLPVPPQDPLQQQLLDTPAPPVRDTAAAEDFDLIAPEEVFQALSLGTIQDMTLTLQSGRLSTSVAQALRKAEIPFEGALKRALQSDAIPAQVQSGDTLELKFGESEDGSELVLQGVTLTLAAEPAPIRMYRFQPSGSDSPGYYDAQGYEYASRLLNSPIDYSAITSYLGDGRNHKGLDLRAAIGTPVRSPFRAQVERINWYTATQGRCVQVVYVDLGIRAKFFHLDEIHDDVVPGRMLEPGEVFAFSGNTGRSTGPHLHYQLEDVFTDDVLDPVEVHGFGAPRLQSADLSYLDAQIAALESPLIETDERAASIQSTPAEPTF